MIELVVGKGTLTPADDRARQALRDMQLGLGEIVHARIAKPRNPRFFRLAHQLGELVRQNVEGFELLTAHQVLKRLQVESGAYCEEMQVKVPGVGPASVRVPQSLAFDSMDEDEFKALVRTLCVHIADQYWPSCTAEQVEQMAEVMVE